MVKEFELGQKLRDRVTGVEGIAIAKIIYLNGCVQFDIKPKVDKDGKQVDGAWVDTQQIELVDEGLLKKEEALPAPKPTGGAYNEAPRL